MPSYFARNTGSALSINQFFPLPRTLKITNHGPSAAQCFRTALTSAMKESLGLKISSSRHSLRFVWPVLSLNIPSLARQRCLSSWGPRRTPWFFLNFSTVWCGRLLKWCFLGFWNYNSVIQALLASNILCLFISTELANKIHIFFFIKVCTFLHTISHSMFM